MNRMNARRIWTVIGGIVALAVAAAGWHLRGCLVEQKAAVSQVRARWSKVRMVTQRYFDEQFAFHDAAEIFLDNIHGQVPTVASIESGKKGLISRINILDRDCNDLRSARYDFSNAWANMETTFLVKHSAWGDISGLCAGWLPLAEQLRSLDSRQVASNRKYRQEFYSTKAQIDDFGRNIQRNREAERKQANDVEDVFTIIANRNVFFNCWTCTKIALGSK